MIKHVKGDLIAMAERGELTHILHGCNCWCGMGAGIAYTLASRYPQVLEADRTTVPGDRLKLGSCTTATVRSIVDPSITFTVINGYTQYNLSRGEDVFEYEAFERLCRYIEGRMLSPTDKIGIPMIGAGLARGDWSRIYKIIEDSFSPDREVTIVEWAPNGTVN